MTSTSPLNEGITLSAKQMQASNNQSFPRHRASAESVLVVTAGRCTVRFDVESQNIGLGEALIIPADEWHQVEADPDFTAVHIMPKDIRFTFSA